VNPILLCDLDASHSAAELAAAHAFVGDLTAVPAVAARLVA
jgi:NADPH-dependent ferric siderophore reductase